MIKNQKELLWIKKHQKEYLCFIQDDIKSLEKNILTFSDEQLDALFSKIADSETLEESRLYALLILIQEKKVYYHKKQNHRYDKNTLKHITILLIISMLLFYALYLWWNNYNASHDQLNLLKNELQSYGITVKEHSKRWYKHTKYWLEVIPPTDPHYKWITAKEWAHTEKILDQIYKLHSTIHGRDYWIFLTIALGIWFSVDTLFSKIRRWLNPQYKEQYEKYAILEEKIQNKIKNTPTLIEKYATKKIRALN